MAFPTVAATATTGISTATTAPVVDLPSSPQAGETLLGVYRCASNGVTTITFPAGWTPLINGDLDGSDDVIAIAWRKATGSEGATITLGSDNQKGAWLCYRISGAADPTVTPPEIQTNTANNGTPNPPNLTPTGGAKDYLWLAIMTIAGEPTLPPTFPTNYGSNQISIGSGTAGSVGTNCAVAGATRELNAASEDPGAYAATSGNWLTATIAVHPAGAPTDSTGSGSPTDTLASVASGTATHTHVGSGAATDTLGSTASGTATHTHVASGAASDTLASVADGDGTMTPDEVGGATGTGALTDTLSSVATGSATHTHVASGSPTDTLTSTASGAAVLKFNASGSPTDTLASTASGDAGMVPDNPSTLHVDWLLDGEVVATRDIVPDEEPTWEFVLTDEELALIPSWADVKVRFRADGGTQAIRVTRFRGAVRFLAWGDLSSTLVSDVSSAVTQSFISQGTGSGLYTLDSTVVARALQADFFGEGAPTSTLVSTAVGEGGLVEDAFTGDGAPIDILSSLAVGVATQTFTGSGAVTSTLSSTAVGVAEQIGWEGPYILGVSGPLVSTAGREIVWPGSVADADESLIQEGDLALLLIGTKNEPATVSPGPTNIDGDQSGFTSSDPTLIASIGTAGNSAAVRLDVRWARATSHYMRSITVNDPGAVVVAAMVVLRNVKEGVTPYDAVATALLSPASTSLSLPGLTTLTDDSLVIQMAYHGVDADTQAAVSGHANSSLATLTEVLDRSFTTGPGGSGLLVVTGEKRTAGAVSATTATLSQSVRAAMVTLALIPPDPPTPSTGTGEAVSTLDSVVEAEGGPAPEFPASGELVSTLDSSASGTATVALDVTGSGAPIDTLASIADGEADSTTVGVFEAEGHPVSTLVSDTHGLAWTRPIIIYPPTEPNVAQGGQGRRKPKRILLPEEDAPEEEQPKVRRRPRRERRPAPEAQPLAELPPPPPAFAPVTFDPMLWASVSAPPVRPQAPVVTQQDIAEEEQFLAQLLEMI